jgi:hypothetical protein
LLNLRHPEVLGAQRQASKDASSNIGAVALRGAPSARTSG